MQPTQRAAPSARGLSGGSRHRSRAGRSRGVVFCSRRRFSVCCARPHQASTPRRQANHRAPPSSTPPRSPRRRTRTIAAGSMRARRVMACGSDVGARAWRSSSASTHSAQHAAARFGRGLATCTPIGPTHGPFHHMCAHRATLSSRGAHARRDRAVDGEVQFASARGAWSSCSAGQLDAAAPRGARRAFGGVGLLAAAARRRAVRDDARCAALE